MSKMRQWTIFTVVAVLVVLVAGWLMLVKPEKSKVSSLKSQASAQNQANQLLLTQIESLQAEQKDLPQQQLTLAKFSTEVPDNAAEPTLIRQLTTAANGAGVDLISITPSDASAVAATSPSVTTPTAPTSTATPGTTTAGGATSTPAAPAATLYQLPVALGISGSYANMISFFQALEKLPRAMIVAAWSMCPIDNGGGGSGGAGAASCSAPTPPSNKTPPSGTLGGTVNGTVFFSAAAPATASGSTLTPSTTTSTAPNPATATTPAASTASAS